MNCKECIHSIKMRKGVACMHQVTKKATEDVNMQVLLAGMLLGVPIEENKEWNKMRDNIKEGLSIDILPEGFPENYPGDISSCTGYMEKAAEGTSDELEAIINKFMEEVQKIPGIEIEMTKIVKDAPKEEHEHKCEECPITSICPVHANKKEEKSNQ